MCSRHALHFSRGQTIGYTLFHSRVQQLEAVAERDALVTFRFWLVAVLGGSVAVFGMLANGLLAKLFVSRINFRHSPFFFLGFVALFDTLLDFIYLLLLTPPILSEHFKWVHLYLYWLPQARRFYLFGQIFKISSCFCLIVASFERYMMTRHWTFSGFDYRTRWFILGCAIFGAIFVKLLTAVDVVVVFNRNCPRIFQRYTVGQAGRREWLPSFINLLTVIIPFGTLVFLNGGIVLMLRHQNVQQLRSLMTELTMGHDVMKMRRRNLRAATNTLLFIISAYLISNLLNLFLSVLEYLYPGYLQYSYPYQYRICSDCASLMTVLGNALRFPAHICSNKEISEQLQIMLCASDKQIEKLPNSAVTTAITLRRFSERVDNPWFSALLTTPRSPEAERRNSSAIIKKGMANGLSFQNFLPYNNTQRITKYGSSRHRSFFPMNWFGGKGIGKTPLDCDCPLPEQLLEECRSSNEENNELMGSCAFSPPSFKHYPSQKMGQYKVLNTQILDFYPQEFRDRKRY